MPSTLLEPSLSNTTPPPKPTFSTQAHFLVGFFGGPMAVIPFSLIGLHQMGKMKEQLTKTVLIVGFFVALYLCHTVLSNLGLYGQWFDGISPLTVSRRGNNLLGVLTFGAIYLAHRRTFNLSQNHSASANPWKAAVICLLGSAALNFGLFVLLGAN
jgi:hypothetical protein